VSASSETINSGTKANKTGSQLENFIFDTLIRLGYLSSDDRRQIVSRADASGRNYIHNQRNC